MDHFGKHPTTEASFDVVCNIVCNITPLLKYYVLISKLINVLNIIKLREVILYLVYLFLGRLVWLLSSNPDLGDCMNISEGAKQGRNGRR